MVGPPRHERSAAPPLTQLWRQPLQALMEGGGPQRPPLVLQRRFSDVLLIITVFALFDYCQVKKSGGAPHDCEMRPDLERSWQATDPEGSRASRSRCGHGARGRPREPFGYAENVVDQDSMRLGRVSYQILFRTRKWAHCHPVVESSRQDIACHQPHVLDSRPFKVLPLPPSLRARHTALATTISGHAQGVAPASRPLSSPAKRGEGGPHLLGEEDRLLESRKVAAVLKLIEVNEVGEPLLRPTPRDADQLV